MAIYNVQANGDAPKQAKAGDTIVTAGGSYQVLDGSKYSGMSKEQLAKEGVGYNPASGLYSRKVSNVNANNYVANNTGSLNNLSGGGSTYPNGMQKVDTSVLDKWLNTANQGAIARLDSVYADNVANLKKAYNSSLVDYENQKKDIKQNYLYNINDLYQDTYYNNNQALENAANRGLTSSGLGNAMVVSGLVDASNQNAVYRSQRDTDINKVNTLINALTKDYNVDLATLKRKLNGDKNAALSDNEIQFIQSLVELDANNVSAYNDALLAQMEMDWQTQEAQKDRDFEKEMYLLQLANQGNYGSGYGGGYSRGYGGYKNRSNDTNNIDPYAAELLYYTMNQDEAPNSATSKSSLTNQQIEKLGNAAVNGASGQDILNLISSYTLQNRYKENQSSKSNTKSNTRNVSKQGSISSWF